MSTPVNQLPASKPSATAPVPDDPEVLNVLKEMEDEVQTATRANMTQVTVPSTNFPHQQYAPQVVPVPQKPFVDYDALQRALIIAAIGFIAFYPGLLDNFYIMSPSLEPFARFDMFVRAVILAGAIYVATTQFGV